MTVVVATHEWFVYGKGLDNYTFNDSREKKRYYVIKQLRVVCIAKNCDLRTKNAALGLWPLVAFSRPQFFTVQTSQPANNISVFFKLLYSVF